MGPLIGVVGGGLSGLSAAIACADAGADVTLFESRLRLGGATWSTQRDGLWLDSGVHVFLRCCEVYRAFLRRLGVEDLVEIQTRLDIPVLRPGRRPAHLRRNDWPAPFQLTTSLLGFSHLRVAERLLVGRAALALRRLDLGDRHLDETSFGVWLRAHGQSARSVESFWDIVTRATINLPCDEASLALAVKVFQTGLLTNGNAADIGISRVPLSALHADPALRELERLGAAVHTRAKVEAISSRRGGGAVVRARDGNFAFDAVVVATPHDVSARLLPDEAGVDRDALEQLGHSPIVNLHVVYDRRVCPYPLAAGVESPVQWIFDRSEASGIETGQCLSLSLSDAGAYVGVSREQLRNRFEPAIAALFPGARDARVLDFRVTCERQATFRQAPGSAALRPGAETKSDSIFLAGAWTATGWPATMEGAVRSGQRAARAALLAAGVRHGLPEAVAA